LEVSVFDLQTQTSKQDFESFNLSMKRKERKRMRLIKESESLKMNFKNKMSSLNLSKEGTPI